jgi:hypothetical protein
MANGELQPQPSRHPALPEKTVQEFIVLQNKELDLRIEELALQKQKDANSFEYAKQALGIKKTDREDQRIHEARQRKAAYIFSGTLTVILASVIIYALSIGKESFATEVIKTIVYIVTSGVGGYGIAKYQARQERDDTAGS